MQTPTAATSDHAAAVIAPSFCRNRRTAGILTVRSDADGMPDRLRLHEGGQAREAWIGTPVLVPRDEHPLDVVGRRALELGPVGDRDAREVDRVDVAVAREPGREL